MPLRENSGHGEPLEDRERVYAARDDRTEVACNGEGFVSVDVEWVPLSGEPRYFLCCDEVVPSSYSEPTTRSSAELRSGDSDPTRFITMPASPCATAQRCRVAIRDSSPIPYTRSASRDNVTTGSELVRVALSNA